MLSSPVLHLQREAGASVGEAYGWHLPSSYSSLADEYEAATRGVGLVDRSHFGRMEIRGADGADLLNRLSTNELANLTPGDPGIHTVLTSNKGRILDLLLVLSLEDRLLVLTGPDTRQKVADWIEFYTFVDDVTVADVTEETAMLALTGPDAARLLASLTGQDVSAMPHGGAMSARIGDHEALVIRTDFVGLAGYDLAITAANGEGLWTSLLEMGRSFGLLPLGMEALEVVRVEQGVPSHGSELTDAYNPLEAGLLKHISFSKGCYIGQEVVTRLDTYDKVQKHLVGISWKDHDVPAANATLSHDGKKVGTLTSAVVSPRLDHGIGLAYVRKARSQAGVELTLTLADGEATARVEPLPFE